jgi:hypothetical protein
LGIRGAAAASRMLRFERGTETAANALREQFLAKVA